jgi:hypothetical protein
MLCITCELYSSEFQSDLFLAGAEYLHELSAELLLRIRHEYLPVLPSNLLLIIDGNLPALSSWLLELTQLCYVFEQHLLHFVWGVLLID